MLDELSDFAKYHTRTLIQFQVISSISIYIVSTPRTFQEGPQYIAYFSPRTTYGIIYVYADVLWRFIFLNVNKHCRACYKIPQINNNCLCLLKKTTNSSASIMESVS